MIVSSTLHNSHLQANLTPRLKSTWMCTFDLFCSTSLKDHGFHKPKYFFEKTGSLFSISIFFFFFFFFFFFVVLFIGNSIVVVQYLVLY